MNADQTPITRTYGHGGITLTAYPSSGRVGVEVRAENAVMDYSDFLDFADQIRKPREVTTAAELDALPVGSVVMADGWTWQKLDPWTSPADDDEPPLWWSLDESKAAETLATHAKDFGYTMTVLHEGGAA